MTFRQPGCAGLVIAGTVALGAAPAAADPQDGLVVQMHCDDGGTYTTIARASAEWNAQLDTQSTSVFHLVWYQSTFTVTAPDDTVTVFGPFTSDKGGNDREHKDLLACTYAFDVDLGSGTTAHVSGPALGWVTPSAPD